MRKGWEIKKLGEVCEFFNGQAHENDIDEAGKYIVINSKFISSEGRSYKRTNNALFPLYKGDITMVMSDVPNGKALAKCFLIDENDKYTLNQRICAIRSKSFDLNFLIYQLNRNKHFLEFNNGENQTNLRKNDILNCPLLVPSIPEQKRIVSILEKAFTSIAKAKGNIEKNLQNAKELFECYVQNVFENKGGDWEEKSLGSVCKLISGQHIDAKNYNIEQKGIGYLTGPSDFGVVSPTITKWTEHPKITAVFDDILITVKGSGVGKINILKEEEVAISRQLMAIRVINENTVFIYFLMYLSFKKLQDQATGAAIPGLSRGQILSLIFPIPSFVQQAQIVNKVIEISAETKKIEAIYIQKIEDLEELKKSIMQKAFNGELTASYKTLVP